MNHKIIGLSLFILLGACGGNELDKLKDEMCACKDYDCAKAVDKKMEEAAKKMMKDPKDEKEQLEFIGKHAKLIAETEACKDKLRDAKKSGGDKKDEKKSE